MTSWMRTRPGGPVLLIAAATTAALLAAATGSVAEEGPTACGSPPTAGAGAAVTSVVTGASPVGDAVTAAVPGQGLVDLSPPADGSGTEQTQHYEGGGYRVTRCNADGSLQIDQVVLPIAVPGNARELVPVSVTVPLGDGRYSSTYMTFGTPKDPNWSRNFIAARDEIRRNTIPPTKPE